MKSISRTGRILSVLAAFLIILSSVTTRGAASADESKPAAAAVLVGPCGLPGAMGPTSVDDDFSNRSINNGIANVPPGGVTNASGTVVFRNTIQNLGAGDDAFILGCGCPLGQAVGIVDGMRIGPDVSPFWGSTASGTGDPSTVYALDAIIARSFMHRRLWLNDPDCLMLRARETRLTADERAALAAVIGASGGMLLISDDMALLGKEEGELFRTIAKLSADLDSNAAREPILPLDLMATGDIRGMVNENPDGTVAMLLNRGDLPARVQTSDLNLVDGEAVALDLATGSNSAIFDTIDLAPHSSRIIRVKK